MIYTFDKLMNVVNSINEDLILEVYEELEVSGIGNKFYLSTEPGLIGKEVFYIGIPVADSGSDFRVYEIIQRQESDFEDEYSGVDFAVKDLQRDGVVIEFRNNGVDLKSVLTNQVLKNSSWVVGTMDFYQTPKTNESFYYQSRWDCLLSIIEEQGCEIQLLVTISNYAISRRFINFFDKIEKKTQVRFEYGSNLLSVTKSEDNSDIITKIYPRGKGEELEGSNGEATGKFTRRITIKRVVWEKSKGDPLDKPFLQEWLEHPELTKRYPLSTGRARTGVVIYEDCDNYDDLIEQGYRTLMANGVPKAEIKASTPPGTTLSLGDIVTVVNYERVYDLRTRVFKMKRYPLEPFKNEYVFGEPVNRYAYNETRDAAYKGKEQDERIEKLERVVEDLCKKGLN